MYTKKMFIKSKKRHFFTKCLLELFKSEIQLYGIVVGICELKVGHLTALYFDIVGNEESVYRDLEIGLGIPY